MTARLDKYQWARMLLPLDLSGERWRVLYSVKEIHRDDVAKVSVTAIAQLTGLNRRTVNRHLRASESEGLIEVEWSKGGRAPHQIRLLNPTATPALLRHPESRSKDEVSEAPYCDTQDVAATATLYACARISTLDLEAGGPPMGPRPNAPSFSTINVPSDTEALDGSAPDAAWKAAGADVAIPGHGNEAAASPEHADAMKSNVSLSVPDLLDAAADIHARIEALDTLIGEFRDFETGKYPDRLPLVVKMFIDRDFSDCGEEAPAKTVAETEAAIAAWIAGTWIEPNDEDEEPLCDRIARLDRGIGAMIANGDHLADEIVAFSDRGYEPDANEVDRIESMFLDRHEEEAASLVESEEVKRLAAERTRARNAAPASPAPAPLSVRITDEAKRAAFIGRMTAYLLPLDREERWKACKRRQAQLVAELKATLPRFKAEVIGRELMDDVRTEVWRRDRAAELDAIVSVPVPPIEAATLGSASNG